LLLKLNLTVAEATREAGQALAARAPYQHPQAVGNIDGHMFNGAQERDDPYLRVLSLPTGKRFRIGAGAAEGLQPGAFLAVYAPNVQRFVGETGKIANARVTRVSATTAEAELVDEPATPLTLDARVSVRADECVMGI
jgi:hypothetical protein